KNIVSTSQPLELLHIDLFGPSKTTSLGGKNYGFIIVDNFSRFTWVHFLTHKSDALDVFMKFSRHIQKSSKLPIISIRSDHGGEFENTSFEDFCDDNGISHQFSAPRTPQQNGVVERKNRTLIDMARTMLCESNLPRYFWDEAVNTACYIINRAMIRPILKKTSYELFKGRKPIVSHLKPFGCKCFVLNNGKDDIGKFDPRSDEAIFLGYANSSSIFRVFNKRTLLVEENAHVIFDESNKSLKKDLVEDIDFIQGLEHVDVPQQEKEEQAKEDPPIESLQDV